MIFETVMVPIVALLFLCGPPEPRLHSNEIVQLSVDELNRAYLLWMDHYPGIFPRGSTMIRGMPALDLYSPAGVSIYYGEDSRKNADFIRALAKAIPVAKTGAVRPAPVATRPTLREAIEMVPEFNVQKQALLTNDLYTLFVISFADWDECKAQNDAVAEFRKRSRESGVRILEVRLH